MHCFNHSDQDAVGLCKACQKGLCRECAADLGHGLACRGVHEGEVSAINALMSRANRAQSVHIKGRFVAPLFYFAVGGTFVAYGVAEGRRLTMLIVLGAAFLAYGLYVYMASKRVFGQGQPDA